MWINMWVDGIEAKILKKQKEMTIQEQLDKIAGEMCDKYCKFPDQASKESKDEDYLFRTYCDKCPMQKLT
jgi:hypothetical protein